MKKRKNYEEGWNIVEDKNKKTYEMKTEEKR